MLSNDNLSCNRIPRAGSAQLRLLWYRTPVRGSRRLRSGSNGEVFKHNVGGADEALIWFEKAKTEFERLGDVRENAVTMGKIADILESRGDLDEALRIRQQEQLPVHEKPQDVDGLIYVLWSCSRIRAAKGIRDQETFDRILGDLSQAYRLAKQLTRLDAICAVALDLGQLLAMARAKAEARSLLMEALLAPSKRCLRVKARSGPAVPPSRCWRWLMTVPAKRSWPRQSRPIWMLGGSPILSDCATASSLTRQRYRTSPSNWCRSRPMTNWPSFTNIRRARMRHRKLAHWRWRHEKDHHHHRHRPRRTAAQ